MRGTDLDLLLFEVVMVVVLLVVLLGLFGFLSAMVGLQ